MPRISFQPVLRDVKDLLKSDFYSIPRFQRPFSWTPENLSEFLRDVLEDNEPGYFVGPMVAYKRGTDVFGIVDGQQRLTTITLLLCALRDALLAQQADDLAQALGQYIERVDDDNKRHYVLKSEAAGEFLPAVAQEPPPRRQREPQNEDQRAIAKALKAITQKFAELQEGLSRDVAPGFDYPPSVAYLREVRDRLLALQVIWIQVDHEDDAYTIFETLNSRGKDLEVADLLKNHLLRQLPAQSAELDSARSDWAEMRRTLLEDGREANPNRYVLHWWLSKEDYVAERKLFAAIKQKAKTGLQAADVLQGLREDALLYARIAAPFDQIISKDAAERRFSSSLQALDLFGVQQPRPLVLALMRAVRDGALKPRRAARILETIENFHFISTAVVGVSSTGGVSQMYASHARDLAAARSEQERHAGLDLLIQKLRDSRRLPTREAFTAQFPRTLRFSEEVPREKRVVRYALQKLHAHERPNNPIDPASCNIEHISPQAHGGEEVASIGNLLWVSERLNSALGAKSFVSKKALLEGEAQAYSVADILGAETWGAREVQQRARRLAHLAYDEVWRI